MVVYIDAGGRVIAVPDDDGVTEYCFWKFGIVFGGVLGCYGGCSSIVAGG